MVRRSRGFRRTIFAVAASVLVIAVAMAVVALSPGSPSHVSQRTDAARPRATSITPTTESNPSTTLPSTPPSNLAPSDTTTTTVPSTSSSGKPILFPPIEDSSGSSSSGSVSSSVPSGSSANGPLSTGACGQADCQASGSTLTYAGGPIISSPHVYFVQLSSAQSGTSCTTTPSGMVPDAFASSGLNGGDAVSTMLSSSYSSWWSEYSAGGTTISSGTYAGCIVLNNAGVNGSIVSDASIQALLSANSAVLPSPNMNNIFVLFFGNGQVITAGGESSGNNFCAYHNWLGSPTPGVTINYVVMPYVSGTSGCAYDSASTNSLDPNFPTNAFNNMTPILSHEIAETVTDPNGNAWIDPTVAGWEIGDLCASGGPIFAGPTVSASSGLTYAFQYLYSNFGTSCINAPIAGMPVSPPSTPAITNLPSSGVVGGGFGASVATNGDGARFLISFSSGVCQVSGLSVRYVGAGTCSLAAAVGVGATFTSNIGRTQTVAVSPAPPPPPPPSSIGVGGVLGIGNAIVSPNGAYFTIFQADGNLVTYTSASRPVWSTGTSGRGGAYALFQADGNFVIYSASNRPIWASGDSSSHPRSLSLGNDGVLTATNTDNQEIWSSHDGPIGDPFFSIPPNPNFAMSVGNIFGTNGVMYSANGDYMLTMQGDGNLVLYGPHGPLWATATKGSNNYFVFQTDGNIVLYTDYNHPLWATGSQGRGGSFLILQNDGNFVIYTPQNQPIWASGT
jgi:hypothetical protein